MFRAIMESTRRRFTDGVNVALGRPAYQMTQYNSWSASLAVDGDYAWPNGTTSCTLMGSPQPWWAVDVEIKVNIAAVTVVNNYETGRGTAMNCYSTTSHVIDKTQSSPTTSIFTAV